MKLSVGDGAKWKLIGIILENWTCPLLLGEMNFALSCY